MRTVKRGGILILFLTLALCLSALCFVPQAFAAVSTVIYDYGENGGQAVDVDLTAVFQQCDGTAEPLWLCL